MRPFLAALLPCSE